MNDSILSTIKEILSNGSYFEPDLILYANSAFSILNQIGIGPESGFRITGDSETWGSLGLEPRILDMVKDYIIAKTRLKFDPPQNSYLLTSLRETISELEFRLNIEEDPKDN